MWLFPYALFSSCIEPMSMPLGVSVFSLMRSKELHSGMLYNGAPRCSWMDKMNSESKNMGRQRVTHSKPSRLEETEMGKYSCAFVRKYR